MPDLAGPNAVPRDGEFSDTLKLLAFVALSVMMMAVDKQTHWLDKVREQLSTVVQPVWAVAGLPSAAARKISTDAGSFSSLTAENQRLRRELMLNRARLDRAEAILASTTETANLQRAVAVRPGMSVIIASVLDVDLDPSRQRLVIRAGAGDGVRVGQTVMDEGGLLGQVISVQPNISTVLLVTDPEHAVPVMLKRNGVRMIASGMGRNDLLDVINVPLSTDIKPGDVVVTSGLGGRFAPGLPVGVVTRVRADDSRAFLLGDIRPAARLDRGSQVMIVTSTYRATAPVAVTAASGSGAAATATAPTATTTPAAATPTDASTTQPTLLRDPSVPPAPKPQLKSPETERPAVPSP